MTLFKNLFATTLLCLLGIVSAMAQSADFNGNRTDFRDESIYFVIPSRFYDGDIHNNVLCWDNQSAQISTQDPCWRGDFAGLIDKLDYIKALGFTAIWITPVVQNASGYDYHGYHAMDFTKVDLRLESHVGTGKYDEGSTRDVTFQSLIDAAHAKGMKIILDIVLNHTGNFGEETLCKEFTRNPDLLNQADMNSCMIANEEVLGADYYDLSGSSQYSRRLALMKNTDGKNHDVKNYWHHVGTQWNWDEPSRWWGQIAGDCVDLNTENPEVCDYLIQCYGEFIKMGVDGFRIDTSGHISRLSFNSKLVPAFQQLGEQYKSKRLNEAPFFMYGEVCARYSEVKYRGHANLSPYFYTWKSSAADMEEWHRYDAAWWAEQYVKEGAAPLGNMIACLNEPDVDKTSNNTFMLNSRYHEPDYSQSSGFNVIDFPLHYNFTSAKNAYGLAKAGDKYYNDATFNVVYIDSHDYGPQPNDRVRFSGSDSQWAENLSLLFTFRGIPCLYYGSEVGFRRGKVIDNGPNGPLSDTGRAYFGGYMKGNVGASDFGVYTADGNAAASLSHDLAQHIIRLNRIRQAVPALRKGQWTSDGCSANGGIAFKRAYKDSYALVALNGGATFTGCPEGTYTDVVTGQKYSGTTITVTAPSNQGQVRVLVKDYDGGIIGEDGAFIYSSAAKHKTGASYDGTEEEGTPYYISANDAEGNDTPDTPLDSYEPTLESTSELSVFYETDASRVSIWVWNSGDNFTGGSWDSKPMMECKGVNAEGRKIFKWTYEGTATSVPTGVIFITNGQQSADLTFVNHGYYVDNVYKYKVGGDENDTFQPSTPSDDEPGGDFTAYFVNTPGWSKVFCYVWDKNNGNKHYAGSWPGTDITAEKVFTNDEGYDVYKWTYKGSLTATPTGIIFNNGSGGNGNQTADFVFENGAAYDFNGPTSSIDSTLLPNPSSLLHHVFTPDGSHMATVTSLTSLQYLLRPGIYVVDGRKFLVK